MVENLLSVLDDIRIEGWQFLEVSPFSMGHFQRRPQTMGAISTMFPIRRCQ
jgi:hypothetical protein